MIMVMKVSKRKRRRFIVKAPPAPKRRDENKGNLIINDHKQTSVASHQGLFQYVFRSDQCVCLEYRVRLGSLQVSPSGGKV